MKHLTTEEIEAGLAKIVESPKDGGVLHLIVRRPEKAEREVLQIAELDVIKGLIGDRWLTDDGNLEAQIAIMNSRSAALLARQGNRLKLAGDQLFIDLDLTQENLPVGTRLAIGSAVIEVTPKPHNGCRKFVERFGLEAIKFVVSPIGQKLRLRGIYAKIVRSGVIKQGDLVKKI